MRCLILPTLFIFIYSYDCFNNILQTIKKLSDDLSLEKNEQKRIREVMARNTPKKSNSNLEQEIQALKETKAGQFNYLNATSFLGNCSTVSVYKNVYGQSLLKLKIRLSMEGSLINFFLNCYTMGLIRLV